MTHALLIHTRPDRNGNSRRAWIISSHGKDMEGFILLGAAGDADKAKYFGMCQLAGLGRATAHLDTSPYSNRLGIFVPVYEFNRLKNIARQDDCLVQIG